MNESIGIGAAEYPWPYGWYYWGIAVIKEIQRIEHPVLTGIIRGITFLGGEWFYLSLILLFLWCIDEKRGFQLGLLLLISVWTNLFFKNLLKQPRPYILDPSVGRGFEPSYGIPSGHAQQSLVFWMNIPQTRPILALIITAVVGFTRLYLGLHFPTDLLGGWLLGGIILGLTALLTPSIETLLNAGGTRVQLLCAAAVALGMNAAGTDRGISGMVLGFCAGYSLSRRSGVEPFSIRALHHLGKSRFLILGARYLLGMIGIAVLYLTLRLLLPGAASLFAHLPSWGAASAYLDLSRFVRYGLLGFWASYGAPQLFGHLGLTGNIGNKEEGVGNGE